MDRDIRLFLVVAVLFAFLFGMVVGAFLGRWRFEESPVDEIVPAEEVVPVEKVYEHSVILDGVETSLTEREYEMVSRYIVALLSLEEEVTLEDITLESNTLLEEVVTKRVCVAVKDTTSSAVFGAIEVGDPTLEDVTDKGSFEYDHSIIVGECNTIGLLETSYVLIVHVDSINIEKILTEEEFELISQILIAVNKTSNEAYIGRHEMAKMKE